MPNEEREKYLKTVVAIDEAAFATRMNVYRITVPGHEGNEENREGNEGNAKRLVFAAIAANPKITIAGLGKELGVSHATVERAQKALQIAGRIRRKGGTRGVWEVL